MLLVLALLFPTGAQAFVLVLVLILVILFFLLLFFSFTSLPWSYQGCFAGPLIPSILSFCFLLRRSSPSPGVYGLGRRSWRSPCHHKLEQFNNRNFSCNRGSACEPSWQGRAYVAKRGQQSAICQQQSVVQFSDCTLRWLLPSNAFV